MAIGCSSRKSKSWKEIEMDIGDLGENQNQKSEIKSKKTLEKQKEKRLKRRELGMGKGGRIYVLLMT